VTTLAQSLSEHFPPDEVQHFEGRGGKTFDYIEDETVMDRLDSALGVGNWQLLVTPISVADGIVQVRLGAKVDGEWVWFEDFGYTNNPNGDALKEAVTDGIRRCGRFLGVGRYLYKKHSSAGPSSTRSGNGRGAPPAPRPSAPARTTTDMPEFPDDFGEPTPIRPAPSDNNECPIHGVTWAGEWGDLWHKTDDPEFKGYCRHPENTRGPAKARR
jgi:hypothetical protein